MTLFNTWCQQEGVLMPKVQYPHTFEGGLTGVKVIEDIENREAYVYIPYKVIMSLGKARKHPVLKRII